MFETQVVNVDDLGEWIHVHRSTLQKTNEVCSSCKLIHNEGITIKE